jgi:3-oxoacyl-[acyl-carrier protein] reductase
MDSQTPSSSPKRLALVTGSSSGIGAAIAQRLARDGFRVLIHYHSNSAGAEKTLAAIEQSGGTGQILQFDVKDSKSIEEALQPFKDISVLVNNAGIHNDGLAGLLSDEAFDQVMKTNAYGAFYLMRFCVRQMMRRREGCIVNVSSLAGQTGNPGQINYAASKAALIAMTKTLAMEIGSRGIRVNAVAPGLIESDMIQTIPQPHLDEMLARIPLRRVGKPEEVAGAVSFLCSPDAGYITGHTMSINGGLFPA